MIEIAELVGRKRFADLDRHRALRSDGTGPPPATPIVDSVPLESACLADQKNGHRDLGRATTTAPNRAASREKNQMPDRPSRSRTYVRTFVSQKFAAHGTDRPRPVATFMTNGTSPTHARPSYSSTSSPAGSSRWTAAGSNDQCKN